MAVEGRWTILVASDGRHVNDAEPRIPSDRLVPVVPCDDEAVGRVAAHLFAESFSNPAALVIPSLWNQAGQETRAEYVAIAEAVLRAAGGQHG